MRRNAGANPASSHIFLPSLPHMTRSLRMPREKTLLAMTNRSHDTQFVTIKLSIRPGGIGHKSSVARRRSAAAVLLPVALAGLVLSGCVTSTKYRMASAETPPAAVLNYTADVSALELKLASVIVYQGPGSWKQDALWDEYVVGLTNRRSVPVDIESVVIIDPLGEKQVPGTDPWALEQLSEANWEKYARVGMYVLGAGAAGQTLGLGVYSYLLGGGAAAGLLIAVPVALIVNVSVVAVRNRRNKGKVRLEFGDEKARFHFGNCRVIATANESNFRTRPRQPTREIPLSIAWQCGRFFQIQRAELTRFAE